MKKAQFGFCDGIDNWDMSDKGFLSFVISNIPFIFEIHPSQIQEVEDCPTAFCVHMDSDILLHTSEDFSWVHEGLFLLLGRQSDVLVAMGRSGPRSDTGASLTNVIESRRGKFVPNGKYWEFNHMTTRFYVMNKLLLKERLFPLVYQRGMSWERLVSFKMQNTGVVRADLDSGKA